MQVQSTYKDIWKIAAPVILGSFATTILNVTDTAYLGRVGEVELGASAVGGILYFAFAMFGVSIGIGTQVMIARRAGEGRTELIGNIFDHTLIILSILGFVLFSIIHWGASGILNLIIHSPELIKSTESFLLYRSYGLIFVMAAVAFRSFYVGIAQPKIFGVYSFLMAAINLVLGYLLVFGNYGFPKMGIAGAGLSSSIAEMLAFIFILLYTVFKTQIKKFRMFLFETLSGQMIGKIFQLSSPIMVQNFLSMGAWFVFFVFIEKIGKHELAISNMVRAVYMISMTPIWGFSIAANSMISNTIGQAKQDKVFQLLNKILKLTLMIALLMIIVNLIIPDFLLHLFSNDNTLVNDSKNSLLVVDLSMIFFSFATVCISSVAGTGATRVALYIEIAAIIIYLIYNYVFTFIYPARVEILWFSEVIYWSFTGIASYYYIRSMRWKTISI